MCIILVRIYSKGKNILEQIETTIFKKILEYMSKTYIPIYFAVVIYIIGKLHKNIIKNGFESNSKKFN